MSYAHNKKWRLSHLKTRYTGKKRYYQKTRFAPNHKKLWTNAEMDTITAEDRPSDRILSTKLGRSMKAITMMRSKIMKENDESEGTSEKS